MRVLRATGENISPSDDASLFNQVFTADGLFKDVTITSLGADQVSVPALYGILQGREFTNSTETLAVELPSSGTATGYIYVRYNLAGSPIGTLESALAPFTPTYEDINTTGNVAEMIIATYTATPTSVSDITMSYKKAGVSRTAVVTMVLLAANWSSNEYSFEGTYPASGYDLEVELNGDSAVAADADAWATSAIVGLNTTNAIKALNGSPSRDLPVMIKVTSK